jgi:hypothetical protein
MQSRIPTQLDDFFFDLRGYLVLEQAVEPELSIKATQVSRQPRMLRRRAFGSKWSSCPRPSAALCCCHVAG